MVCNIILDGISNKRSSVLYPTTFSNQGGVYSGLLDHNLEDQEIHLSVANTMQGVRPQSSYVLMKRRFLGESTATSMVGDSIVNMTLEREPYETSTRQRTWEWLDELEYERSISGWTDSL